MSMKISLKRWMRIMEEELIDAGARIMLLEREVEELKKK